MSTTTGPSKLAAVTVLGPVSGHDLGPTLMHEHLIIDMSHRFTGTSRDTPPQRGSGLSGTGRAGHLDNPKGSLDNLRRTDVDEAVADALEFARIGGGTIVEATTRGLHPDRARLREVARRTGLHIVSGTGVYVHSSHDDDVHGMDIGQLRDMMLADLLEPDDDGARCGIIGEIGVDDFAPCEVKSTIAAAQAGSRTGAAVSLHVLAGAVPTARGPTVRLVRQFIDSGGDSTRLVVNHQDGSGDDPAYQDALLREGVTLAWDTFGFQTSFRRDGCTVGLPSDERRIREVLDLWDRGWGSQVVLSHDICYRMMTTAAGGWGMAHLGTTIAMRMRDVGLGGPAWDTMVVDTPRRLLASLPVPPGDQKST